MRKVTSWLMRRWGWLGLCCSITAITLYSPPARGNEVGTITATGEPASLNPTDSCSLAERSLDVNASADCTTVIETDSMFQVRSVNELSDVQPSDWAFQALQTLIERYGLIGGFPDGTFRGNHPLTRDEFAVALLQVFRHVEELLASGQIAQVREDFATLRRLQATYGTITASLSDRLDQLDNQLDLAEQRNFSPTTKLSGQTVGVLTDGTRATMTGVTRVRLDFSTSFSGRDLLLTQLEAGNSGGDAVSRAHNSRVNLLGTTGLLADGGGLDYVGVDSAVQVSKLHYTFQPVANLSLTVGARLHPRDFIDYNRFANSSDRNFSGSFFMNNPLIIQNQVDRPGGAGLALAWKPADFPLTVRALYTAADADRPNSESPDSGLLGDRYQGSLELDYSVNKDINVRLQFTRALINNTHIFAGGINAEWAINRQFAIFGRYGIGTYDGFNSILNQDLDLTPQTWAIGTIIRNIVIPGSTAGLAFGQPFLTDDVGNANQTNIEAFYSFLVNDNISFTPALMVATNPNNNRSSGTIWEFLVRMVFSF